MYKVCPKCGADAGGADSCPGCGIVFAKWMKRQFRSDDPVAVKAPVDAVESLTSRVLAHALYTEEQVNIFIFGGRLLTLIGLTIWSIWFFQTDYSVVVGHFSEVGSSFMHSINLVFHEAGHVLFIPFGRFMTTLGGSLFQLIVPAIFVVAFVFKHENPFGGAVTLWWLGQSAMDLAPYINDARAGQLLLVGGFIGSERPGYHDWTNILGDLGLLTWDHTLAGLCNGLGMLIMVVAIGWGVVLLRRQFENLDRSF